MLLAPAPWLSVRDEAADPDRLLASEARSERQDVVAALRSQGWDALILWECETGDDYALAKRLQNFLDSGSA